MDKKPTYEELEQKIKNLEAQAEKYKGLDLLPLFKGIENSFSLGITDPEGILIYVNDPLVNMWGYSSQKDIIGRSLPDFWEGERVFDTISDLINFGLSTGEDIGKKKDGSLFNVEYVAIMCKDNNDEPLYMIGQFFDITDRKQVQEELLKERDKLQKAVEEIKKLSGMLPICSSCKKIRDDKGYWNQIESYICAHSEAEFSHSICPDCARKLYPEFDIY